MLYYYKVHLNGVFMCESATQKTAIAYARKLNQVHEARRIRVTRNFDWDLIYLVMVEKVEQMFVEPLKCKVLGHKWDSDRPAGRLHKENICWRCDAIKKEPLYNDGGVLK